MIPPAISARTLLLAAGFLALAGASPAAWIIPTAVTATSEQGNDYASLTIDGSGLSQESVSGLHAAGNHSWSFQQGNAVNIRDESITFDLGGLYDLTQIHVWQFTRTDLINDANRSVRTFDILVSADNVTFTEVSSDVLLARAIDSTYPTWSFPDGNEPVQSFALVQSGVRYVQPGIDGTYERSTGDRDWQGGFGEVRFEGSAIVVPEPSLAGVSAMLCAAGVAFFRRR